MVSCSHILANFSIWPKKCHFLLYTDPHSQNRLSCNETWKLNNSYFSGSFFLKIWMLSLEMWIWICFYPFWPLECLKPVIFLSFSLNETLETKTSHSAVLEQEVWSTLKRLTNNNKWLIFSTQDVNIVNYWLMTRLLTIVSVLSSNWFSKSS